MAMQKMEYKGNKRAGLALDLKQLLNTRVPNFTERHVGGRTASLLCSCVAGLAVK